MNRSCMPKACQMAWNDNLKLGTRGSLFMQQGLRRNLNRLYSWVMPSYLPAIQPYLSAGESFRMRFVQCDLLLTPPIRNMIKTFTSALTARALYLAFSASGLRSTISGFSRYIVPLLSPNANHASGVVSSLDAVRTDPMRPIPPQLSPHSLQQRDC
jgi:hypothetical protein